MKKMFPGNKEAIIVFGFMTFVWIFRVAMALLSRIPASVLLWAAYGIYHKITCPEFKLLCPSHAKCPVNIEFTGLFLCLFM